LNTNKDLFVVENRMKNTLEDFIIIFY